MVEPVPYDVIVAPEGEPLVFAGPPRQLTGRVELHNRSDVDVVLRDAILRDPDKVFSMRPMRQSISPLVLKPYEERRLLLTLVIDPTTPPGEYRAEVELAGQCRTTVLHVSELLDITVRPPSIVLLNRPDQPQRKRIVVANDGNVAFAIGHIGDVDLEDDFLARHTARVIVEPPSQVGKQEFEKPLVVLLRIAHEGAYVEAGMSVRKVGDELDLAPGETMPIDLDITLQKELRANSRFRGRVPFGTRDLEIIVVPSSEPRPIEQIARRAATKRQGGRR
ncbi:MAG: hypothetical protein ACRETU_09020 [Steroidobacterales bacterium]